MDLSKNYKFTNIEDFEKESERLSGLTSQLSVLIIGLDKARRKRLKDFAWSLMREWREEQKSSNKAIQAGQK